MKKSSKDIKHSQHSKRFNQDESQSIPKLELRNQKQRNEKNADLTIKKVK